jgi:hypothetical protein
MSRKTDFIFKILNVVSWVIFVGLCVQAGGFIFNAFFTLFLNPAGASKFWNEVDLSALYYFNQSYFVIMITLMIIVLVMKALLFYFIVEVFHGKKFNLSQPFNEVVKRFILNMAFLSLGIGLFSFWGTNFGKELVIQGLKMPDIQDLSLGGADVWLFMSVILFVIAQIFKKGIEMQTENDLTI